ncbi:hypothetical protein GCM10027290_51250 [Micromonospora sonneratiae]|uniref:Uncharacterized protein n=1 Tax=Micromonospora sonneratiae TaxID=1184706 RepID=A0ABW3YCY0_9ACTN
MTEPVVPRRADNEVDIAELAQRVPVVQSQMFVELVSNIGKVQAVVASRRSETFFSWLVDQMTGRARAQDLDTVRSLALTQANTLAWVNELAARSAITDLALRETAVRLRVLQYDLAATRDEARYASEVAERTAAEVSGLARLLGEMATVVHGELDRQERRLDLQQRRLDLQEKRMALLEARLDDQDLFLQAVADELDGQRRVLTHLRLRQYAWEAFSRSMSRYRAGAYRSLPWMYQVALLAREVAAGACGLHEFVTGDRIHRDWLVESILDDPDSVVAWSGTRSLVGLLDEACAALPDRDDRQMVAELLGAGPDADDGSAARPLSAVLARTMRYAAGVDRSGAARSPAADALDEVRSTADGLLETSLTVPEFVHRTVDEQADAGAEARARLGDADRTR